MKVFYTFGTDPRFPFCGGWVEIDADNMKQAHAIFRACYPDRDPGILNCSDYYTEAQFKESDMLSTGNRGAFCHRKISRCDVYGWVNGEPVFSRDEFVFKARHRGAIEDDAELLAFAEKVTGHWYSSGWRHSFESFYLSDYALSEPRASLTLKEFDRLKELQQQARDAAKAADDAREWKLKDTIHWADNSVEEIWIDKDGIEKREMIVGPHGDVC